MKSHVGFPMANLDLTLLAYIKAHGYVYISTVNICKMVTDWFNITIVVGLHLNEVTLKVRCRSDYDCKHSLFNNRVTINQITENIINHSTHKILPKHYIRFINTKVRNNVPIWAIDERAMCYSQYRIQHDNTSKPFMDKISRVTFDSHSGNIDIETILINNTK